MKTYLELKHDWDERQFAERNRKSEKTCQSCGHDKAWHYNDKCNNEEYSKLMFSCNAGVWNKCSCKEFVSIV